MKKSIIFAIFAMFLLAGCGKDNGDISPAPETPPVSTTEIPTTENPPAEPTPELDNASFAEVQMITGISDAELEKMARRSLVQSFDRSQMTEMTDEAIRKYYSETVYKRAECIKSDPTTFTYSIEGDEVYLYPPAELVPDSKVKLAPPSENKLTAELGFISARLENDRIYVTFSDDEDNTAKATLFGSQYEMPGYGVFEVGKEYELTGLYSRYTDIFISTVGNLYLPALYLVTEDGCLEFVNLYNCVNFGQLCPMPIPCDLRNSRLLHPEEVIGTDESSVCTELRSGEYAELSRWINAMPCAMPSGFYSVVTAYHETDEGNYCDVANITLDEYGSFESSTTAIDDLIDEGYGTFKIIGMNDSGLLFGYSYFSGDSIDPRFGVVSREIPDSEYDLGLHEIK